MWLILVTIKLLQLKMTVVCCLGCDMENFKILQNEFIRKHFWIFLVTLAIPRTLSHESTRFPKHTTMWSMWLNILKMFWFEIVLKNHKVRPIASQVTEPIKKLSLPWRTWFPGDQKSSKCSSTYWHFWKFMKLDMSHVSEPIRLWPLPWGNQVSEAAHATKIIRICCF